MGMYPTVGLFIPGGYLDTCNSVSVTGQSDQYGTVYPSGTNAGKAIFMGDAEAANLTKSTTVILRGGAYQWVNVDSSATTAYVAQGLAAFIKLDSSATTGVTAGVNYAKPAVTSEDQVAPATAKSLFAGVFLNSITPGNWGFIFTGAGIANVNYKTGLTNGSPNIGDNIVDGAGTGLFDDAGADTVATTGLTVGKAITDPVSAGAGLVYIPAIQYRIPN